MAAYPNSLNAISLDESSLNPSLLTAFAQEENGDEENGDEENGDGETEDGETEDEDLMEDAADAIADANEEIDKADEKITKAADEGKDTSFAELQLEEAIAKRDMAQESFDSGDFEVAEELAEEAEDLASESRSKLIGKTEADLEDDGEEEEDEIELKGILTVTGDDTFDLETGDGTEPISINDDTEIDDGLSLSELEGLEVEVEAVEIDGVLFATEIEFEEEEEAEDEEEEEIEIEVELEDGVAKVKVKFNDQKHRFLVMDDTSEDAIASTILALPEFPLDTIDEIKEIWDFEVEDEEGDPTSHTTAEFNEWKAEQESQELYDDLLQQITELEDRIQALLEKYESGEYYGNVPEADSEIMSYTISFTGSGISQDDDSVSSMKGKIFIDSLITDSNTSKYTVTAGEISIDDVFYDFIFGKVRVTSSGNVMLIGQVINWADENDDSSTIKLVIQSDVPLEGGFGSQSLDIEILPQSKIAGQWYLSGSGILS